MLTSGHDASLPVASRGLGHPRVRRIRGLVHRRRAVAGLPALGFARVRARVRNAWAARDVGQPSAWTASPVHGLQGHDSGWDDRPGVAGSRDRHGPLHRRRRGGVLSAARASGWRVYAARDRLDGIARQRVRPVALRGHRRHLRHLAVVSYSRLGARPSQHAGLAGGSRSTDDRAPHVRLARPSVQRRAARNGHGDARRAAATHRRVGGGCAGSRSGRSR